MAASPFGMEIQFDILSDGALGQTVGVSAQFPLVPANTARLLWEPAGGAAQLMEFAVDSRAADARWRRVRNVMFSTAVQDGNVLRALYCIPSFAKFRVRTDKLLDAKIYLQAGAVSSSHSRMLSSDDQISRRRHRSSCLRRVRRFAPATR